MTIKKTLLASVAVSAMSLSMAYAGTTDLIGSDVNATFNAAGWSNSASLNMTSGAGNYGAQVAGVSVASNLDFNIFGVGLGASSGWSYGEPDVNGDNLGAGVTMTYAHDRDIDVSMAQDGAGTTEVKAQSLGFLDVGDVSASGTMIQDGEIVTAKAGGSLGGAISVDEGATPVASASTYSAKISSSDQDFVGVVEQDNYALTLAVVNAQANSDGTSTDIAGGDISVGDTLAVSVLGNVALDVANKYADFRDSVLSNDVVNPIDILSSPEDLLMLNPIGAVLSQELGSTDDNFVVVTQLGGDANLSAVVADGVGTIDQLVANTTVMKGSIFAGITSTFTPVAPPIIP